MTSEEKVSVGMREIELWKYEQTVQSLKEINAMADDESIAQLIDICRGRTTDFKGSAETTAETRAESVLHHILKKDGEEYRVFDEDVREIVLDSFKEEWRGHFSLAPRYPVG